MSARRRTVPVSKRAIDVLLAALALVVLAPVMLVTAALVRIVLGSPVLFRQQRPGLHGRIFHLMKFRTMRHALGPDGRPLPDAQRMTGFGRFLRSSSLDELPALLNVIRGDMSLVGPRPLLPEYMPLYTPEQNRRHEVLPGITGWAQVNGRNAVSWERKFELDVWYVDHQSFWLDIKILLMTIAKVFKREGISQQGHVTAEKFRGSR